MLLLCKEFSLRKRSKSTAEDKFSSSDSITFAMGENDFIIVEDSKRMSFSFLAGLRFVVDSLSYIFIFLFILRSVDKNSSPRRIFVYDNKWTNEAFWCVWKMKHCRASTSKQEKIRLHRHHRPLYNNDNSSMEIFVWCFYLFFAVKEAR